MSNHLRQLLLLTIAFLCSCSTDSQISGKQVPSYSFMPRSQLTVRNDKAYRKGTTTPFTGVTVEYRAGFDYAKYIDGIEILEELDVSQYEKDLFPSDMSHQQAVRDLVDQVGPGHSTYFFYAQHGRESDLPVLLYGLKQMGESYGEFVCTRLHCLDALQKITGAGPGMNYSDWRRWWRTKYKTEVPAWKPKMKNHNKPGLDSRQSSTPSP